MRVASLEGSVPGPERFGSRRACDSLVRPPAWGRLAGRGWRAGGVTLLEFIISVAILGLVVGMMVDLIPLSHIMNHRAWDTNTAQSLACTGMAAARSVDFAVLASTGPVVLRDRGTDFTSTTRVSLYQGSATLKLVTVTVAWTQNGGDKEIVLNGLVVETGNHK